MNAEKNCKLAILYHNIKWVINLSKQPPFLFSQCSVRTGLVVT